MADNRPSAARKHPGPQSAEPGGNRHCVPAKGGNAALDRRRRSRESRVLHLVYRLVTANLWLRTAILASLSVALIMLAFHWHVTSRPSVPAFLAAQLGTGLLVGAVGAALVQGFIMSDPRSLRKLMDELRSDAREASLNHFADQVAALRDLTGEGIRSLEAQLSALGADFGAHDRRGRTPTDEVLSRAGVVNIHPARGEAAADFSAALGDSRVTAIRLQGLSLGEWFGGRRTASNANPPGRVLEGLLLGEQSPTVHRGPVRAQVLLLDPNCAAARLLTRGAGGHGGDERLERLRSDVWVTADHLRWLREEVTNRGNGNSLEVRFYRAVPGFFAFSTDLGSFVRQYFAGGGYNPSLAPVWHYRGRSAAHEAVGRHFDAIWQTSSVPDEQLLLEKCCGLDQGIDEGGICNVYTTFASAQERISWLILHAKRRVWIQGLSLVNHLSPPLEDAIHRLFQTRSVDTRLLILDPNCEQAYLKSYRDSLIGNGSPAVGLGPQKYRSESSLHLNSLIYANIRHSTQRLMGMIGKNGTDHFQLRHYTCAPTSYILIADDQALVEQFHYGKPPVATNSVQAQLQLAKEMPLVEYHHPQSTLFEPRPGLDPLAVIEDHFTQVFNRFAHVPINRTIA